MIPVIIGKKRTTQPKEWLAMTCPCCECVQPFRNEDVIQTEDGRVDCFPPLFSRDIDDGSLGLATGETLAHLNCLLARRMMERDVRFVQLFHRGWDHHSNLPEKLRGQAAVDHRTGRVDDGAAESRARGVDGDPRRVRGEREGVHGRGVGGDRSPERLQVHAPGLTGHVHPEDFARELIVSRSSVRDIIIVGFI